MGADRPAALHQITTLRNDIRDLGDQVDSYQAKTAGALGAGVFLLLLALGGAYDLINHNTSLSGAIGISQASFRTLVIGLGGGGGVLFLFGLIRRWRRDREQETRLAELEQELARLESDS
jgi:hypothetical protein